MTVRPPMQVFLTVDTELWPTTADWPERPLARDKADFADEIATDVHGLTNAGGYGLPYQIGVLNHHGLKASYFVEALCMARVGAPALRHIVGLVQDGGHQVQLHLHTEWLGELDDPSLPPQPCQYMCQLDLDQQSAVIRRGLDNLRQAGVARVHACRAGSYGGNLDTLRALARNGIHLDSSYNPAHLVGDWGPHQITEPQRIETVWEFPVTSFRDYPGHVRHTQLCAVSHAELRRALQSAWRQQWRAFVIVLHSFEMVRRGGAPGLPSPNRLAIRRFEQLCAFLAAHRDQFQTTHFSELTPESMTELPRHAPLRSRPPETAWRMLEQVWSNVS